MKVMIHEASGSTQQRAPFSLLVVGCGVLILLSLILPYFKPPFGGENYWQWLCAVTIVLGSISLVRKERGTVAIVALAVTGLALSLLLLTVVVPVAYSLAMRLLMPD